MRDSAEGVHLDGHRAFVGGNGDAWDQIGDLQFHFLVGQGLNPSDTLIDVACGALRGGRRFIRYLEPRHYLGIEQYIELIIYGVAQELGIDTFRDKQPQFVISPDFEFDKFVTKPTFGIAQSLFSHLAARDIGLCLSKLRAIAAPGCKFFATFFETEEPVKNPAASQSHTRFAYTRNEMECFGTQCGWTPRYIGDWNHPRGQKIIEYFAG